MFMGQKNQYSDKELYYPKQSIDSMLPTVFFTELNDITICVEIQAIFNSQSSLDKEEWGWRNQPA